MCFLATARRLGCRRRGFPPASASLFNLINLKLRYAASPCAAAAQKQLPSKINAPAI
jgi:hypothetical protein